MANGSLLKYSICLLLYYFMNSEDLQRRHYAQTASSYDTVLGVTPEHEFGLYLLLGILDAAKATSLLDVGAGTGRGLRFLMEHRPKLVVHGIEPVEELRIVAQEKGVPKEFITAGGGYTLPFPDDSFDIVTEFGVLHHVETPALLVREMLRVARLGIYLSDTNNLGQGSVGGRVIKNLFYWFGFWKLFNYIRTKGKGSVFESTDGLWYYYTLFEHFPELARHCHSVHVLNTRGTSRNHWFSASHAAIFATKPAILNESPFFLHLR